MCQNTTPITYSTKAVEEFNAQIDSTDNRTFNTYRAIGPRVHTIEPTKSSI